MFSDDCEGDDEEEDDTEVSYWLCIGLGYKGYLRDRFIVSCQSGKNLDISFVTVLHL